MELGVEQEGHIVPPSQILESIQWEWDCQSFTDWQQGLTPKEHLEMNLIQKQREWQKECDREDREWRDGQAKQERKWRKEDTIWRVFHFIVGVIGVAIAAIIVQIVSAFIRRGGP